MVVGGQQIAQAEIAGCELVGFDDVIPLRRRDLVVAGKEDGDLSVLPKEVSRTIERVHRVGLADEFADGGGVDFGFLQSVQDRDVHVVDGAIAGPRGATLHGREQALYAGRGMQVLGVGRIEDRVHQETIVHIVANFADAIDQSFGFLEILAKPFGRAGVVRLVLGFEANLVVVLETVQTGVQLGVECHHGRGRPYIDVLAVGQGGVELVLGRLRVR